MDFDQKVTRLERILKKRVLKRGEYTSVAKECLSLIEQALQHVFRRHLPRLDHTVRLTVRHAEADIGQGTTGIENFTLGQLVAVLRSAHVLDAWERVSGKDLEKIRLMNLDELTTLYTTVIHGDREATRAEAEFLFNCLHVMLETFGITSNELDEPSPDQASSHREAAAILLKGKGPSDGHDQPLLFVSYARADDQPAPGVDDGRVTQLIHRLKTLLRQKLDREDGYALWIDFSAEREQSRGLATSPHHTPDDDPPRDLIPELCRVGLVSAGADQLFRHGARPCAPGVKRVCDRTRPVKL